MFKKVFNTTISRVFIALAVALVAISCNKDDETSITLGISPQSMEELPHTEDSRMIYITSQEWDWELEVREGSDWLSASQTSGSADISYDVNIYFSENPDTSSRSAIIFAWNKIDPTVYDSIPITQLGQPLDMIFETIQDSYNKNGGSFDIDILSNVDWELVSISDWMTLTKTSEATPSSKPNFDKFDYNFTIQPNPSVSLRQGSIVFKDKNPENSDWTYEVLITQYGSGSLQTDTDLLKDIFNTMGGDSWTKKWDITQPIENWQGVKTELSADGNMRVVELDLSGCNLVGELPENIGDLSFIKILDLSDNEISGTIPQSITSLNNSVSLSLNHNKLTGEIPAQIGELRKLWRLHLNNNQLTGNIPVLTTLEVIQVLTLNDNMLTGDFPAGIEELINLEYFYVQNNKLSGARPDSYEDSQYWTQWQLAPQN